MNPICQCNRPELANNTPFPREKGPNAVRVMSANVLFRGARFCTINPNPKYQWHGYRDGKVTQVFNYYAPDALLIQEADPEQIRDTTDRLTSPYGVCGYGSENGHSPREEFLAILYNKETLQYLESGFYVLSETPDDTQHPKPAFGGIYSRIVTWAVFKQLQTSSIWLIQNTHMDHNAECDARLESVKVVAKKTEELAAQVLRDYKVQPAIVFAGDCNFFPPTHNPLFDGERAYQELLKSFKDVRDISLEPPYGQDGTMPGYPEDPYCHKAGEILDRTDHMGCSDNVVVIKTGVIADNSDPTTGEVFLQNQGNERGEPGPSDHHFVVADFVAKP